MVSIESWVESTDEQVGGHLVRCMVMTDHDAGVEWAAGAIPAEYASPANLASILERFGKPAAAKYLQVKMPTDPRARSGDLGEIIGTRFTTDELAYTTVSRLRWKDHRQMAMRGDDIIGLRLPEAQPVEFLKGEVKSRASLKTATVSEADTALQSDDGRPSPHALIFVADRLREQEDHVLADAVYEAALVRGIGERQVEQLLFAFTGTDPGAVLRTNTEAYQGRIRRLAVGLHVTGHGDFVEEVYAKVIADA